MDWGPLFLMAAFMLLGAGGFVGAWIAYRMGSHSKAWPSVTGRVTASGVSPLSGREGARCVAAVAYEYSVNGQVRTGSRIGVARLPIESREAVQGASSAYVVGKPVEVWYDPADPGSAVLVRGPDARAVATFGYLGALGVTMSLVTKVVYQL